jgi:hypothetical protein
MTATYRLKGLGWLAIAVFAALGFYLVSLQVSVERKKLEHVNREIAQAQNDLRSLQTEFSTRANLAQLERWNGDVLALTAPTAAQYMANGQQLASLGSEGPGGAEVQMASLVIPTLPVIATPAVDDGGVATTPAPAATVAPIAPKATPAKVEMASAKSADPLAAIVKAAASRPVKPIAVSHAKEQAMAMLDRKLLSDSTLGDLMSKARAETASLR